jgi:hypothetical protein
MHPTKMDAQTDVNSGLGGNVVYDFLRISGDVASSACVIHQEDRASLANHISSLGEQLRVIVVKLTSQTAYNDDPERKTVVQSCQKVGQILLLRIQGILRELAISIDNGPNERGDQILWPIADVEALVTRLEYLANQWQLLNPNSS